MFVCLSVTFIEGRYASLKNKTKYFRLRLFDEVGTERPETDLILT